MWSPDLIKYYAWLIEHIDRGYFEEYDLLLFETWKALYTNFSIPNDENRATDGFALRDRYMSEKLVNLPDFGECRMLELLIGLAMRMNDSFYDWDLSNQTAVYFWEMMKNLQLTQYTNEYFVARQGSSKNDILTTFTILNNRTYDEKGQGGLFPLGPDRTDCQDQRKVELWYQMMAYMAKAY